MKAHEYAKLLLKGPNLELLHSNTDYQNGEEWSPANLPERTTPEDMKKRGVYWNWADGSFEWQPYWGDAVLIVT